MKQLTVLLPALIAGAVLLTPAVAYADPPSDWDTGDYSEQTDVLDPVACTWTTTVTSWTRQNTLDPDTSDITGWEPWGPSEIIFQEVGPGTEDECPDWHIDENGDWYYQTPDHEPTPPAEECDPEEQGGCEYPLEIQLEGVITDVMKVGLGHSAPRQ